ncbi:MAG: SBBP repeat-containing protein, partial [Candidatus Thorarchaeota archaeon]
MASQRAFTILLLVLFSSPLIIAVPQVIADIQLDSDFLTPEEVQSMFDEDKGDIPIDEEEIIRKAQDLMRSQFQENLGQVANPSILFYGQIPGGLIGFGISKVFIWLENTTQSIVMSFDGANEVIPIQEEVVGHTSNYFLGDRGTFTGVASSSLIIYRDIYPGVDLQYQASPMGAKYEYHLDAGVDPSIIKVRCEGQESITLGSDSAKFSVDGKAFIDEGLVVTQNNEVVQSEFISITDTIFGFNIEGYDVDEPLVIDPLVYSTFMGGSGTEMITDVVVDSDGYAYLTGYTSSSDFPAIDGYNQTKNGLNDIFILKLSPTGNGINFGTFFGGSLDDYGYAIDIDSSGNAYCTGVTYSDDMPMVNAFNDTYGAGLFDAFILALSNTGDSVIYSTYYGGNDQDMGEDIAVTSGGEVIMVGSTTSTNLQMSGGYDSTYNGGDYDSFVVKLNSAGSSMVFATYVGGTDEDYANAMAIDDDENIYVTGYTMSNDFPMMNAFNSTYDSDPGDMTFLYKLDSSGTFLNYSTYLESHDGRGVDVDAFGNAHVVAGNYVMKMNATGNGRLFITEFSSTTRACDVKVDDGGYVYVLTTDSAGQSNIVDDPGFESGAWGEWENYGSTTYNQFDTSPVYSGTYSMWLQDHYSSSPYEPVIQYFDTQIPLSDNPTFSTMIYPELVGATCGAYGVDHIEIWMNDTANNKNVRLFYEWSGYPFDSSWNTSSVARFLLFDMTPMSWNLLERDLRTDYYAAIQDTVLASQVFVYRINLLSHSSNGNPGDFWVDDVAITTQTNAVEVVKLNSTGEIVFQNDLGLQTDEWVEHFDIDTYGNQYVVGRTTRSNFVTLNPYDDTLSGSNDGFILKTQDTTDSDSDGLLDYEEEAYGTNRYDNDTDADLMPDGWEVNIGLNATKDDASEDPDADSLLNIYEYRNNTLPFNNDTDSDSLSDYDEIVNYGTNPNSNDTEGDGMPDAWEVAYSLDPLTNDTLGDGDVDALSNLDEYLIGTNPSNNDTDFDLLPDGWEYFNGLNATLDDANLDNELDGLNNTLEYQYGTDPFNSDSDSDLLSDGLEVFSYGTNPALNDTEGDGMPDGWEVTYSLLPLVDDSTGNDDTDNLTNLEEFNAGTLPNNPDCDSDTLLDGDEVKIHGTDPWLADTDGDTINDYDEIYVWFSDPNDPNSPYLPKEPSFSTYLGGSSYDCGYSVYLDDAGYIFVSGYTQSSDFPVGSGYDSSHNGNYDAFITKYTPDGQTIVFSTFIGGSGHDNIFGMDIDDVGNIYVTGYTASSNFPMLNAYQSTFGGNYDTFITKLNSAGNALIFSTYYGGSAYD